MIKKSLRSLVLILPLLPSSVFSGWSVGGVYTFTFFEPEDSTLGEFNPTALLIRGSYDLFRYVGFELRAGTGILDGERAVAGIEYSADIKTMYGGYMKLQLGGKDFNPYFLAGYTSMEIDVSGGTYSESFEDDSGSLGVGVEGSLSDNVYFNLEYVQYFTDVNGIGLGLVTRF